MFVLFLLLFFLILNILYYKLISIRLSLIYLVTFQIYFIIIGLFIRYLNSVFQDLSSLYFLICWYLSFVLGLTLAYMFYKGKNKIIIGTFINDYNLQNKKLIYLIIFFLFLTLCIYHFVKLEIPLFSEELETLRFKQAESGLIGIPSRTVNFGIYFYLIFILLGYFYRLVNLKMFFIFFLTGSAIIILIGHKSAPFVIFSILLLVYRFSSGRVKVTILLLLLVFLFFSIIYLSLIITKYYTLSSYKLLDYIVNRIFFISSDIFDFTVGYYKSIYPYGLGKGILVDFQYLLYKIAGIHSTTVNYDISSNYYQSTAFAVPVTITIFGYLYLEFDFIVTMLISMMVGFIYYYVYIKGNLSYGLYKKSLYLYIEFVLADIITKGNPIYSILNYFYPVYFFLFVEKFLEFLLIGKKYIRLSYLIKQN